MRRIAILILLYVGMQLVIPLGVNGSLEGGAASLLVFGFLVLAAYTVGEFATFVSLPRITGYLFAGIIFGPSLLGAVSPQVTLELEPVNRLAIALIAFLAGAELRVGELRERARTLLTMMGVELVLSFVAIVGTLVLLRAYVPFFRTGATTEVLTLAALFAAVAIVHSPAVVMALLTETRAHGPVARTTLGIVLVADVVVVLLFSGALALTRALVPSSGQAGGLSAGVLAWEIGGSVLVGAVLGGAIALYMRFVRGELLMFAIVVTFLGAEIARLLGVETLLTLLVAGFVTENATRRGGGELLHAMERSAAPVFVVFFALAGASIQLGVLASIWPLALTIVAVRIAAIGAGARLGARWSKAPPLVARYSWMGLVSQAGVAIGLVTVVADAYPTRGPQMATLFLSVIAINETIGAPFFRWALSRSGELEPDAHERGEESAEDGAGVGARAAEVART